MVEWYPSSIVYVVKRKQKVLSIEEQGDREGSKMCAMIAGIQNTVVSAVISCTRNGIVNFFCASH